MSHIELAVLAEYWLGNESSDAIEEHLLSCDACTATLDWIARLSKGIAEVVRRGNLSWVLTPEFLARLAGEGLRIRTYTPPLNGSVQCTVTSQDDLLMGRLRIDLANVSRLDILAAGDHGVFRAEDIPFKPSSDAEIVLNEPVGPARVTEKATLKVQLISVEQSGDRILGEFTFNHSVPLQ